MPNINAPFGLKPIRYASGAPYNGAANAYIAQGATGAIFIGDPVAAAGSANSVAFQGHEPGTLPTIIPATGGAGNQITGVCVGVLPVNPNSQIFRENGVDRIILVADDPDLVFIAQSDSIGAALAADDTGQMTNLVAGAGSVASGLSGWMISTAAAPGNAINSQIRLNKLHSRIDNELGAFAVWEVSINNHLLANVNDGGRFTAA